MITTYIGICLKAKALHKKFQWEENALADPISWSEAATFCSDKGFSLCRAEQICNKGAPLTGVQAGDHWTPTADKNNEWIQIGKCNAYLTWKFR